MTACTRGCLGLLLLVSTAAADELFEGLTPGLVGAYQDGRTTRTRVDGDVSFDWRTAAPIPEFARGPFTAEWTGILFVRSDTTYRFSAFACGSVRWEIDGKVVVDGSSTAPGWITGPPTPLEFGFLPVKVTYRRTGDAAACKLYWSSDLFPTEPLPHHLLFHEGDAAQARLVERGRVLFDAHRCNRCHARGDSLPSAEAPPFIAVAADLNPDWIVAKLQHLNFEAADSKMPSFGYSADEAQAIGAWLWHINQPPRITPLRPAEGKPKDLPDGLTLVRSVGCLACHKLGDLGTIGPFGGGDLSQIGAKRTADWLNTWLATPDRIHPERQMPVVKLSPTERSQIAAALAELGHKEDMTYERPQFENNTQLVQQGRELITKARCFNCHKTPALDVDLRGLPTLNRPVADWERTCLAETADPAQVRPYYPQADRAALRAYVQAVTEPSPDPQDLRSPSERLGLYNHGRLVLERRNCLACHERDGAKGIVETAGLAANGDERLRGLSEALIPPNLTAVGDKLQDKALAEAVAGDQEAVRLPWLQVRMPKFNHSPEERAALVEFFIAHDRIPPVSGADAPNIRVAEAATPPVDSETLLLGRQLVGAGGFSCIACHSVGDYTPRNTALGTRGSDLKGMGSRLREEFYYRWTRAPLRIVPGMEMPSYEERPVKGVLNGDVHQQLAVLWKAAGDPRFEAPTNPSQVEQLLAVKPGERPRVVRDVFTVSKENGGGYVPRAFALGFGNGHSLLFDLDRACVRDWTFGDFARQRTEGKSWYWDLAGAPVVKGLRSQSEFVLQRGDEWIALGDPAVGTAATLVDYREVVDGVVLTYRLPVPEANGEFVELAESWKVSNPAKRGPRHRITRGLTVNRGVDGAKLWFVPATTESLLLNADVERGADWRECGEFGLGVEVHAPLVTHYVADEATPAAESTPRPEFPLNTSPVTTAPGFTGERLPIPTSMMPTAIAVAPNGDLGVTSLKGHLYVLRDSNGDGVHETANDFDGGLAAPFGILPGDPQSHPSSATSSSAAVWLVVHKPELTSIADLDGDGRADDRRVVASGWGYTDNYHDWSAGPVRDAAGNLYVATSSDYAQPGRPEELCQWRGKVLRVAPDGEITPIAHELRYPMGVAFDPQGRLFVSDQQGVANCFNEIDHIVEGGRYGVRGLYDPDSGEPERRAAIQIPHPWTRSVNGIFFIPSVPDSTSDRDAAPGIRALAPFAGHGIGCEYNGRFLIRFSLQEVDGELQGATYAFTRGTWADPAQTFLGPMCGTVAANGEIYIGSIHDSGWLGGLNTGEIVRLRPTGAFPNGIRELRAVPGGFEIEFLHPVDPVAAVQPENYTLSGYTRVWKGSYATEDSGQYAPQITSIAIDGERRTVRLSVDRLEPSYVYDVAVKRVTPDGSEFFPDVGYYTMNRVPRE